jgi:ABC-type glycerol-3-phosphate transport system substrate-binding protein
MTAFTSMLPPLIDAGTLAPLDQCIADGGFGDRILPSVSFAQVDGVTYGVPLTMSPWSVVVNKKLLADAGIAEMPKTVEELYEAAKVVKEKTGAYGYAFGNDMAAPLHVYINSMQWVLGLDRTGRSPMALSPPTIPGTSKRSAGSSVSWTRGSRPLDLVSSKHAISLSTARSPSCSRACG